MHVMQRYCPNAAACLQQFDVQVTPLIQFNSKSCAHLVHVIPHAPGGQALQCAAPGLYRVLHEQCEVEIDTAIMRDLNRTFPQHVFFMSRQGPGQRALYNILRAYAAFDRQVRTVLASVEFCKLERERNHRSCSDWG